ncbi:PIN domain-containing protein [Candidatus Woesearchaeota archaeon]|nr:PIN domain-containing protein [Candidatus Woesearchaeota archaeon]
MKYYVDTSIWIDVYEDRKGYSGEPLGSYALKFLAVLKAKGECLVISDILITELECFYSIAEIKGMMKPFEEIIEKVMSTKIQREETKIIAHERNIPKGDALHAILVRDNKLILITRDNDFRKLKDVVPEYYKPEELI